jgi:hypothetical protein
MVSLEELHMYVEVIGLNTSVEYKTTKTTQQQGEGFHISLRDRLMM